MKSSKNDKKTTFKKYTPKRQELSSTQVERLIQILEKRFVENIQRHLGLEWAKIKQRLEQNLEKLWSLNEMESTGGEPDVVGYDEESDEFIFYDCSSESPKGRRSACYDQKAWERRKANKPANTVQEMAEIMGISVLTEKQYRELQKLGNFDTKTSSWVETPSNIRELGGAIFCDRRYDNVFTYHNSAESYYAARGFRGCLKI